MGPCAVARFTEIRGGNPSTSSAPAASPSGSPPGPATLRRLANADRALKGDITLSSTPPSPDSAFTGPQIKALGKELTERIVLERLVDRIVSLAG